MITSGGIGMMKMDIWEFKEVRAVQGSNIFPILNKYLLNYNFDIKVTNLINSLNSRISVN